MRWEKLIIPIGVTGIIAWLYFDSGIEAIEDPDGFTPMELEPEDMGAKTLITDKVPTLSAHQERFLLRNDMGDVLDQIHSLRDEALASRKEATKLFLELPDEPTLEQTQEYYQSLQEFWDKNGELKDKIEYALRTRGT